MPTLLRGVCREWFAPKAQRPSCIQRLLPSSRGLANRRASFELLVIHVTPRTPTSGPEPKPTARCRADTCPGTNARMDASSGAGLQPRRSCPCFQGQRFYRYNPTSSFIFLGKAKLYKENPHSLCFRNTHLTQRRDLARHKDLPDSIRDTRAHLLPSH